MGIPALSNAVTPGSSVAGGKYGGRKTNKQSQI
ncbi:hypothetical protein QN277_023192 [Acacia crassicarpa]|uniref:Uncharacterized protein n=1 Tax=Acacia crassicarpa TaxID=499986 RepID=A0AAE1MQF2_9FABA|nr:hypothetical protein QN277_023192 [Acacia crassicarpa]